MNERQKQVLMFLINTPSNFIQIQRIADRFNCSEKTIRNDFKQLQPYLLDVFEAQIERKASQGVRLHINSLNKKKLIATLNESFGVHECSEDERLLIAYQLLMAQKPTSIQELCEQFYLSRSVLKEALKEIANWLSNFSLLLITKQKTGLYISGSEREIRQALTHLDQLRLDKMQLHGYLLHHFLAYELDVVRKLLKQFQDKHIFHFTDESFERMVIHILLVIKRTKLKQSIELPEQDICYIEEKEEFLFVLPLMEELAHFFQVTFPKSESIYVTMHVLAAKLANNDDEKQFLDVEMEQRINQLAQELTVSLSGITDIPFTDDDALLEGLQTHFYATLNRLKFKLHVSNPLVQDIKKMYPYLFDMLMLVLSEMEQAIGFAMPEDEIAFLTLHYQAAFERLNRSQQPENRIGIVCHMGVGVSEILRAKLETKFPFANIVGTTGKRDLARFINEKQVDLLISTIPIELSQPPHLLISPLLNKEEEDKLRDFIKKPTQLELESKVSKLNHFMDEAHVFLQVDSDHRFKLIEQLANRLYLDGFVAKDYAHQALLRERAASTAIGGGIAIPHGDPSLVEQSAIAVATLRKPLDWDGERVSLVFLLAIRPDSRVNRRELYQRLTVLAEQHSVVNQLVQITNKTALIKKI
ncbi:activator of the mannose operon, transcriptional antiterminator [Amphibacillus marinus]|uniref:Activator of the mannose operon, transcriptional antiterminator n=1 Tax=Amphibacillus marinus TaxID=872970 RepID=A0A1H8QUU4_9BACI|nr:BglG family transcription antiterminator [Amphibacillus marinus]SEO57593.1 activator of the mannose operon, transcriptional antiterminator [Amphibacillus marinus]